MAQNSPTEVRGETTLTTTPVASPGPPSDAADLEGAVLDQGYRILKLLGEGGMGAVYRALTPSGETVALKLIRGQQDAEARRRFAREVKSMQAIENPHVVRVLDASSGGSQRLPFLVMELLQGQDLGAVIRQVGPIDPSIAARIFLQASQGLAAIHELGVVHRDIKPSNIFLHESDGALSVKVCDFGVAKNTMTEGTGSDLTHTGGIVGSPHYMSPEQVQDSKRVDHRSDLWSLSMAMYEALSGRKGWASCSTVGELLVAVCTRDLPWLQEEAPWVPGELAAVVHRNLQKSPAERFQSAAAMAAALAPLAAPAEALTSPDALAVSDQVRSVRAPDLRDPALRDASAGNRTNPATARASSSRPLLAGALLAGLLAAGIGALQTRKEPPAAAPIASVEGRLRVPAQSSIWVRGERQTSNDGWVKLGGHPGEAILVAVEHQGARVEKTVTLTRGGQVVPGEIEVSAPPPLASTSASAGPAPTASAAPDASTAVEGPRPGRTPRPGQPTAPAAPTTQPATAPTTPPATAPTLKLQKEW